jgi:hypothetical protein
MAILVGADHDYQGVNRPTNLPAAAANGQPVIFEQLDALRKGLAWKDSCRTVALVNISLTAPGAAINGITMASGDRLLLTAQTTPDDNGIYIWSGAAAALVRSPDADTAVSLESAVVTIEEGTLNAGQTYRQSAVNFVLGTGAVNWAPFNATVPPASETVAGVLEVATQAETDTGTDDSRAITPLKLKTSTLTAGTKKFLIGDGTATAITCTHNHNTFDVGVEIVEATGNRRNVTAEVRRLTVNAVQILIVPAPAVGAIAVYITRFAQV